MLIKNLHQYIPYILPIIGVSFFGWSTYIIILFFCIENIIQGVFFLLRGLSIVRNFRGIMFLLVGSALFFSHAIGSLGVSENFNKTNEKWVTTSWIYLIINIIIIAIPHIFEFYYFYRSQLRIQKISWNTSLSKKEIGKQLEKQDMRPTLDYILDFYEMFGRLIVLWISFPIMGVVLLFSSFFNINTLIMNMIGITIFSVMHYMVGRHYVVQREKVFTSYQDALQQK